MRVIAFILALQIISSAGVQWKPAPRWWPVGSEVAFLEGTAAGFGTYTLRARVPSGMTTPLQTATVEARYTILSGSISLRLDASERRLEGGSFFVIQPSQRYSIQALENSVLQVTTSGASPMRADETGVEAHGTVRLADISPKPGEAVSEETVIRATVEYDVEPFAADTFPLSLQFDTNSPNQTMSAMATMTPASAPVRPPIDALTSARGRVELNYPLSQIWNAPKLARPIRVRVFLHERTGEFRSRVVARTETVTYR